MNWFSQPLSKRLEHHKENARTKPNGKFVDEDYQDEEDALLEKVKYPENNLKKANEIIEAQKNELVMLRKDAKDNTQFLHSIIMELIQRKAITPSTTAISLAGPKAGAKLP